jgi:DNA repair protein RadA/Sms
LGRCPTCEAWNSLAEELARSETAVGLPSTVLPIAEVDPVGAGHRPTGVGEVDRVLGGGLVPGSVTLAGGEPGIGKSTLLLQVLASMARSGATCLLVTAEESAAQIRLRAERLGALAERLYVVAETAVPNIVAAVHSVRPDVLVVDSVQTIFDPDTGSAPGTVTQVRDCAARLVGEAKARAMATVLVGHVTKEGTLAGPRLLEHLVDTVLAFEGDRHHALRLLRAVKHRYGSTSELGIFEMGERGLIGVPDASGLFLADRRAGVSGSVVVPAMEGDRPLLVEVQALVSEETTYPQPRRYAQGVDHGRVDLLLAVLERFAGLSFAKRDVHASAVGGVRLVEPGADLAVALAIASSALHTAVPADLVACGEVGLAGELRQAGHTARRLTEASRLGFHRALVPHSAPEPPTGIEAVRVSTLTEAIARAGLLDSRRAA